MGDPDRGAVEPYASGGAPSGPGFWFPPTVAAPARPEWRLAREEIFGPVVVRFFPPHVIRHLVPNHHMHHLNASRKYDNSKIRNLRPNGNPNCTPFV